MTLDELQVHAVAAGISSSDFWDMDFSDIYAQLKGYSKQREDQLELTAWHASRIMTTIVRALGGKRDITPADLLGKVERVGVGSQVTKGTLSKLAEKVMYGGPN